MINETDRDVDTLPAALLAEAKAFMRISYASDDAVISMMIGAAIESFERTSGITVFETDYDWSVEEEFIDGRLKIGPEERITPIAAFTATADPASTVVTSQYKLERIGLSGVSFYNFLGAAQPGLAFALTAGYTAATLPAGIKAILFQMTSRLFEYRDILVPSNLQEIPGWINEELAGYWVPRV